MGALEVTSSLSISFQWNPKPVTTLELLTLPEGFPLARGQCGYHIADWNSLFEYFHHTELPPMSHSFSAPFCTHGKAPGPCLLSVVSLVIGITSSTPVLPRNLKTILWGLQVAVRANGLCSPLRAPGAGQVVPDGEGSPGNRRLWGTWGLRGPALCAFTQDTSHRPRSTSC